MIIWINGSFGVGKTTVAQKLKEKIDKSIIYDPEKIGMFLSKTLEKEKIDIKHFILIASKENIISRLNARGNSTEWAYMQVDRCDKTFKDDCIKGQKIDTNNKSVGEVCNNLIKLIYG